MPVAQIYVKNLMYFYSLKRHSLRLEYKYELCYYENRGALTMFGSNDASIKKIN